MIYTHASDVAARGVASHETLGCQQIVRKLLSKHAKFRADHVAEICGKVEIMSTHNLLKFASIRRKIATSCPLYFF